MTRPALPLPDPPIHTLGFRLRPWSGDDVHALHRAWSEPSIASATAVPEDPGPDQARRWITGEAVRREDGIALDLVIADADADDVVLGEVGVLVHDASRGLAELGWWLFPEARGHGIAASAVMRLGDHVFRTTPLQRLFARIPDGRRPSERVAERAGLRRLGVAGDRIGVWARDRPDRAVDGSATVDPRP